MCHTVCDSMHSDKLISKLHIARLSLGTMVKWYTLITEQLGCTQLLTQCLAVTVSVTPLVG